MSVHRRFYRNAKGKRVPRPNYYVKLWDAEKGKPVWHVGSPDRRDTQALELALIDEREAKRAGTAPPAPSGETGLESHVAAYESHLAKKNDSPAYVSLTGSRVRAILAACEFTKVTDVAAGPVLDYLRSRLTRPDRPCPPIDKPVYTLAAAALLLGAHPHSLSAIVRREGLEVTGNGRARRYPAVTVAAMQAVLCRGSAVGTVNAYLTAFRGFTAWLANPQVGRAAVDPMRGVKRFRVSREDERVRRRFMSADELTAILDAAGASKRPYRGMSGPARRMIYLVGMSTGFRCSELASMSAGSFALEASPPVAAVRAGYTKNKRAATQPLPADVAEAVRATYTAARGRRCCGRVHGASGVRTCSASI
jgi:hypothetical protein